MLARKAKNEGAYQCGEAFQRSERAAEPGVEEPMLPVGALARISIPGAGDATLGVMWPFDMGQVEKSRAELLEVIRQEDQGRSKRLEANPALRRFEDLVVIEAKRVVSERYSSISFREAARRSGSPTPPGARQLPGGRQLPPGPHDPTAPRFFEMFLKHGGLIAGYRRPFMSSTAPVPLVKPEYFTNAFEATLLIPNESESLLLPPDAPFFIEVALGRSDLVRTENGVKGNRSVLGRCPDDPDKALRWAKAVHCLIAVEHVCRSRLDIAVVAEPGLGMGIGF